MTLLMKSLAEMYPRQNIQQNIQVFPVKNASANVANLRLQPPFSVLLIVTTQLNFRPRHVYLVRANEQQLYGRVFANMTVTRFTSFNEFDIGRAFPNSLLVCDDVS